MNTYVVEEVMGCISVHEFRTKKGALDYIRKLVGEESLAGNEKSVDWSDEKKEGAVVYDAGEPVLKCRICRPIKHGE